MEREKKLGILLTVILSLAVVSGCEQADTRVFKELKEVTLQYNQCATALSDLNQLLIEERQLYDEMNRLFTTPATVSDDVLRSETQSRTSQGVELALSGKLLTDTFQTCLSEINPTFKDVSRLDSNDSKPTNQILLNLIHLRHQYHQGLIDQLNSLYAFWSETEDFYQLLQQGTTWDDLTNRKEGIATTVETTNGKAKEIQVVADTYNELFEQVSSQFKSNR